MDMYVRGSGGGVVTVQAHVAHKYQRIDQLIHDIRVFIYILINWSARSTVGIPSHFTLPTAERNHHHHGQGQPRPAGAPGLRDPGVWGVRRCVVFDAFIAENLMYRSCGKVS